MSEKIRKLKENASRLIAKGKLADAADEYVKIVRGDPRDLAARQKLAELYARLGRTADAVREYQSVAGSYAADGLLLKAIAVCKIILQVDPRHSETQAILAELSTRRRGDATAVEMPKAMSAAIVPGKRSASEIRGKPAVAIAGHADGVSRPQPTPPSVVGGIVAEAPASYAALRVAAAVGSTPSRDAAYDSPPPSTGPGLGRSAQTDPHELMALVSAPVARPAPPSEDVAYDVSFDSSEGAPVLSDSGSGPPVVMGASLSQEGAAVADGLPADEPSTLEPMGQGASPDETLPADDLLVDDDGAGDVLELQEPAQIDVDKVPPIPLFSDLPKEAFIALTERMDLRMHLAGDVLVREGEPGASMFVIIQGKVAVKRKALEGDGEILLAELDEGAFFGEMALLSDAPRMASVVCAEDTMLFELSRELLENITERYPSVGAVMQKFHKNRLLTNLLKTSPIFQPFSTQDKKALIEKFKSRAVGESVYLITRERPGEGLYVLLSGRCEVLDEGPAGREILLAELKEGDVFGEMSMLWHKRTCASVRTTSPCVVLRLPKEAFSEVIMTHPQILEVLTGLSERRQKHNTDVKSPAVAGDFLL